MGYLDNRGLARLWGALKTALAGKQDKLPAGGYAGQALLKASGTDGDVSWGYVDSGLSQEEANELYVSRVDGTVMNSFQLWSDPYMSQACALSMQQDSSGNPFLRIYVGPQTGSHIMAPYVEVHDPKDLTTKEYVDSMASGGIPSGIVAFWPMDAAAEIPEGWALCDGTDGRPNAGPFMGMYFIIKQ